LRFSVPPTVLLKRGLRAKKQVEKLKFVEFSPANHVLDVFFTVELDFHI